MSTDFNEELRKLKWHVRLLCEASPLREHPTASLVIGFDWAEEDLDKAHDIFEKFSNMLEAGEDPKAAFLEKEFREALTVGYQGLKNVVRAFHQNGQWLDVCEWYVGGQVPCPVEFHEIKRLMDERESLS